MVLYEIAVLCERQGCIPANQMRWIDLPQRKTCPLADTVHLCYDYGSRRIQMLFQVRNVGS